MWSKKRSLSLVVVLVVSLLATSAAAEDFPFLRFKTPAVCTTEGGSTVNIPIGRFIPEESWDQIDTEWQIMEDNTTRLEAENKHLKASESPVGWKTSLAGSIVGILIGRYALKR